MKLGIIGAMSVEVALLKEKMENMTVSTHAGMEFCAGTLEGMDVVVVQCGVGKVNAAMCAQILCSIFGVTHNRLILKTAEVIAGIGPVTHDIVADEIHVFALDRAGIHLGRL